MWITRVFKLSLYAAFAFSAMVGAQVDTNDSAGDLALANILSSDRYPKAKCLDGSQGRYYFRKGRGQGLTKFYLHQQGGGFCTSFEDCLARSKTNLGSTLAHVPDAWGPTHNLSEDQSYFSINPRINPLLYNWNHIFMVYCDGAYFAGDNSSDTIVQGEQLYFAGRHILDATLHHLLSEHDLFGATDVMLGGCSAGAIATFAHVDYVARALRGGLAPQARVTGFPDSGFYVDLPYFEKFKVFPFVYQNVSATLSDECLQEYRNAPWKCLIAERNAAYLQTPLFAWQSKYDGDQLRNSFENHCTKSSCATPFANRLVKSMRWSLFRDRNRRHGAFVDGCWRHCQSVFDDGNISAIAIGQLTPLTALSQWYTGSHRDSWFLEQPAPNFPCASCCPRSHSTNVLI
mmetsp:Transcript_58823/g.93031  ORF Transcript_58823/g.93031 Transcript_58823/m.93031 type:complete len:402 (+) Transcript_58823:80-1285(+)